MEQNTLKKIYGFTNADSKTSFSGCFAIGVIFLVIMLGWVFFVEDDVFNQVVESL